MADDPEVTREEAFVAEIAARWPKMAARARVAAEGGGIACHTEAHELVREIQRLKRWKAEALQVLNQWDEAWQAAGCPGQLGESIPMATAAEISRLRATLADRDAWCEHLAQRESALLLAVRRPFRSRVNRRAERIQRGVEA